MPSGTLRIWTVAREDWPADLDAGPWIAGRLADGLAEGSTTGLRGLVLRDAGLDLVDLDPWRDRPRNLHALLAGLTTTHTGGGPARAVGLLGTGRRRQAGGARAVGVVFLEWPDNAWWLWQVHRDPDGRPIDGTALEQGARWGDPLPSGLGRWWSAARRRGLQARLTRHDPPEAAEHVVH